MHRTSEQSPFKCNLNQVQPEPSPKLRHLAQRNIVSVLPASVENWMWLPVWQLPLNNVRVEYTEAQNMWPKLNNAWRPTPHNPIPLERLTLTYYRISMIYTTSFSNRKMAMNASWGTSTLPTDFIRFLPSACFFSNFFLRVMSPP